MWEDPDANEKNIMSAADLKGSVSLRTVLDALGVEVTSGNKIHSPFNGADNTPSCHIYDDEHFYDFSTGQGGDIIDLVMTLGGMEWSEAARWLTKLVRFNGAEPVAVRDRQAPTLNYFDAEWKQLGQSWSPALQKMVNERWGLAVADLVEEGVKGSGDSLYIPHYFEGHVVGIKIRRVDGEKTSVPGSTFTKKLYTTRLSEGKHAVIVEGEPDLWVMHQMPASNGRGNGNAPSLTVYALPSGAGSWKDSWAEELLGLHDVIYVCTDNDEAGKKARDKITHSLKWKCEQLMVPALYNDVADAYKAGWRWNPRMVKPETSQPTEKTCKGCSTTKPIEAFCARKYRNGQRYYPNFCRKCENNKKRVQV